MKARICTSCNTPVVEWFRSCHINDTVRPNEHGWPTFMRPFGGGGGVNGRIYIHRSYALAQAHDELWWAYWHLKGLERVSVRGEVLDRAREKYDEAWAKV